jgi:uncharacterized protein YdaT
MKAIRKYKHVFIFIVMTAFITSCVESVHSRTSFLTKEELKQTPHAPVPVATNKIRLALLLDTSSSMNGLIEQAKSQLWEIVNTLAQAQRDGEHADLQIALYQYGNSRLSSNKSYIEQILPLTGDLDEISNQLFKLTTQGGDEYCGAVIEQATNELEWEKELDGLNLIFIAGNEPFNQGRVNYQKASNNAAENNIIVNTIYCGDESEGVSTFWQNGAMLSGGIFASLEMNKKTIYTETPYDDQIATLNERLNRTYLAYGTKGSEKKANQISQDNNSKGYSRSNLVNRAITKSSHLYNNSSWDLVDAAREDNFDIENIEDDQLPEEMRQMNEKQREEYLTFMQTERNQITSEIKELNAMRKAFLNAKNNGVENGLNNVLIGAIKKQAKEKGFSFAEGAALGGLEANTVSLPPFQPAYVNFDFFEETMQAAKAVRAQRLINMETFTRYAKEKNTIILDTRSKEMYDKMHIKGAVHLNFSDFNQTSLAKVIPTKDTRVLIYCNNNFSQQPIFRVPFVTKAAPIKMPNSLSEAGQIGENKNTLALNIPTYINLYGYGYQQIYELSELLFSNHPLLELEGTDVK